MKVYTAWGKDGYANTLIDGEGPPRWSDGDLMTPEECPDLIWTIGADSFEEACIKYNELQGWEPYRSLEDQK